MTNYNEQPDGTFKMEFDVPRIYDFVTNKYRPVTQADVDGFLKTNRALCHLMTAFRELVSEELGVFTLSDDI